MNAHPSTTHSTLSLERTYPAARHDVFAAWAVPAVKARWFAGSGVEHSLDFRVGGEEHVAARVNEADLAVTSVYRHPAGSAGQRPRLRLRPRLRGGRPPLL